MDSWIPISTLPEDAGTKVIYAPSADDDLPFIGMAWYEPPGTGNMPGWQLLPDAILSSITHWMPLPKRPLVQKGSANAESYRPEHLK